MYLNINFLAFLLCFMLITESKQSTVEVAGPGLYPQDIVMPARYFFVNFTSVNSESYTSELAKQLSVDITGTSNKMGRCRVWVNKLDRKDGSFIVRYKIHETCQDLSIYIYYKNKLVEGSPIVIKGPVYPDQCNCPEDDYNIWLKQYGCPTSYKQIEESLKPFEKINMQESIKTIIARYHNPDSTSFCHYSVVNNEIYRNCYGKHVGFNMFMDSILLFLSRRVRMPDMELVVNLGDWPLVRKNVEPVPVFSWCGSDETIDIILPTYDITESTLENMGRVSMDMLSVQGGAERKWSDRETRAFWRGRDSRAERLKLIDISRANPELLNASLTNFFFFRDKEAQYGPKQPHVSFFKFFDYKYQINIDGTVASYRLPYLLAGGSLVLKQVSPYYEHFYKQLTAWEHYVPFRRDLSNLKEQIEWAIQHEDEAKRMAINARKFANDNLLPQHVICYHAVLFKEWSSRLTNPIIVAKDMTHVPQQKFECDCQKVNKEHEEL